MNLLSELTVDAKPNTQSSLIYFLYSYSYFILFFFLLLLLFVPPPLFCHIFFFLLSLIFDNSFSNVMLQFISSLFTVKNCCLVDDLYILL